MKSIFLSLSLFFFTGINAQNINPYSHFRLDRFYNLFLEEEAELLDEQGRFTGNYNPKDPLNPPRPDVYYGDYLPIVFTNNTVTSSDSEVYIVVTGQLYNDSNTGVILQFDPATGKGSIYEFGNSTGQASDYAIALSSLPTQQDGARVIHVPQIQSARVWISINNKLTMAMSSPAFLVEPNFKSPSDPNYNILYDFFEFNFQESASPPIFVNATAVDFFSMPIQMYLQGATTNKTNGIANKQSVVFSTVRSAFDKATTDKSEWKQTILSNEQYPNLRILSPGKAAAGDPILFDTNFYQNPAFDYLSDIWTGTDGNGTGAYYKTNQLSINLELVGRTYTGTVNGSGEIVLTCDGGGEVTFYNPTTAIYPNGYTASVNILTQTNFLAAYTGTAFPDDYLEVQNLFTQGILAGLVPTTETLKADYFQQNTSKYFTVNPYLSSLGQATGPWYSIYSQALLHLGPIYTMSVSEDLFPDVQISGPYTANQTYIGVTLSSLN